MQRKTFGAFCQARVATSLLLALSAIAQAQTTVVSPETATVAGRPPVLATATIQFTGSGPGGSLRVGDTLTANYTLSDPDTDVADLVASDATIQWVRNGSTPIGTPGSKTYQIVAGDMGQTISYRLVPHTSQALTDPYQGSATLASDVDPTGGGVVPQTEGTATGVAIVGNPEVGTVLTANVACGGSACGGTMAYKWQVESAFGSASYVDIAGATNSTYTPTRDDQRKRIKVEVTQTGP